MNAAGQQPKVNATRFDGLGFMKQAPGLWRFVDTETSAVIGPMFARNDELLATLATFAQERGFTERTS